MTYGVKGLKKVLLTYQSHDRKNMIKRSEKTI